MTSKPRSADLHESRSPPRMAPDPTEQQQTMPATFRPESANHYRIDVSGLVQKSELENVQGAIAQEIARIGKVRLLFVLDQFKGWQKGQGWGDMDFYEKHGQDIERIAIVGEEKWRDDALMFALADLRKAPTRYFLPAEFEQARTWLAQA